MAEGLQDSEPCFYLDVQALDTKLAANIALGSIDSRSKLARMVRLRVMGRLMVSAHELLNLMTGEGCILEQSRTANIATTNKLCDFIPAHTLGEVAIGITR